MSLACRLVHADARFPRSADRAGRQREAEERRARDRRSLIAAPGAGARPIKNRLDSRTHARISHRPRVLRKSGDEDTLEFSNSDSMQKRARARVDCGKTPLADPDGNRVDLSRIIVI